MRKEFLFRAGAAISALIVIGTFSALIGFLLYHGLGVLNLKLFFGDTNWFCRDFLPAFSHHGNGSCPRNRLRNISRPLRKGKDESSSLRLGRPFGGGSLYCDGAFRLCFDSSSQEYNSSKCHDMCGSGGFLSCSSRSALARSDVALVA